MKRILTLFLAGLIALSCAGCGQKTSAVEEEPELSQMQSICELAVMDCYYHNVAKYSEDNASGMLWWSKDKTFWIEYSGIVTLGIDASQLSLEVNDTDVTITIPQAEIQGCKVDSDSLTEDSFYVDTDSAKIEAEDEQAAFSEAQANLEATAAQDTELFQNALLRAQELIENYVNAIGEAVGKEYTIHWVVLDNDETDSGSTDDTAGTEETDEAEDVAAAETEAVS